MRPARRDDLAPLWAIFQRIAGAGDTYAHDASTTRDDFDAYWFGRGGEQWVVEHAGRLSGAYTLRDNHPGRGRHVATASYVVDAEVRGHGLGRRLGEHSIERARALGYAAMQFNLVVASNAPAIALWHSLGFAIVGTLPEAFAHAQLGRVDALVMHRRV